MTIGDQPFPLNSILPIKQPGSIVKATLRALASGGAALTIAPRCSRVPIRIQREGAEEAYTTSDRSILPHCDHSDFDRANFSATSVELYSLSDWYKISVSSTSQGEVSVGYASK